MGRGRSLREEIVIASRAVILALIIWRTKRDRGKVTGGQGPRGELTNPRRNVGPGCGSAGTPLPQSRGDTTPGEHRENNGRTAGEQRDNTGRIPGQQRENTGRTTGEQRDNTGRTNERTTGRTAGEQRENNGRTTGKHRENSGRTNERTTGEQRGNTGRTAGCPGRGEPRDARRGSGRASPGG